MANPASKKAGNAPPQGYFQLTKDPLASFILVLPLLLTYQVGLFMSQGQLLNGADLVSVVLLRRFGWNGLLAFSGVLLVVGIAGVLVLRHRGHFDPKIAIPVVIESTIYAVLLGVVVTYVLNHILPAMHLLPNATGDDLQGVGPLARIFLAIGAGVNEEFVFRLGMFSGILALGQKLAKDKQGLTVLGAVGVSSVLFSLAHYLGPEAFAVPSFLYRFLAGAFFCGLFWLRGFAICVYTHAIYDVMVMVVLADH